MRLLGLGLACWLSLSVAQAIDTNEFKSFTLGSNDTSLKTLSDPIKAGAGAGRAVCLTRGIGAGANSGAVGYYEMKGGKAVCSTTDATRNVPGSGRDSTVYYMSKAQFLWAAHHGGASVTSSAVRWGKHASGSDVIPCKVGTLLGHVTTSGGGVKCFVPNNFGGGKGTSHTAFDVIIQKSKDKA
jgi:hypothetical protein